MALQNLLRLVAIFVALAEDALELADAKLEWIAAGTLTDNFPELMLSEEQREIYHRYTDPLMQELIKDMCILRALRHDVFVRGARRINVAERAAALMDVHLSLVKSPDDLPDALNMPAGRAELNTAFYGPIVKALSMGPRRVGDLLELPDVVGRRDNPAELISILIGAEMVEPTARPGSPPGEAAMRFNSVSAKRMMAKEPPNRQAVAACQATGIPLSTPLLALVLVDRIRAGTTDVDGLMHAVNANPEQGEEARKAIEECLNTFIPPLKNAGVF